MAKQFIYEKDRNEIRVLGRGIQRGIELAKDALEDADVSLSDEEIDE